MTDQCGVFKLQTNVAEYVRCPTSADFLPPHKINVADATAAMKEYCGKNLILDPAFDQTTFIQDPTIQQGQSYDNYNVPADYRIRMVNQFQSWTTGCGANHKYSTKGDECIRKMTAIINKCKFSVCKRLFILSLCTDQISRWHHDRWCFNGRYSKWVHGLGAFRAREVMNEGFRQVIKLSVEMEDRCRDGG